jgi:cardiolipin synthase A/B
VTARSRLGLTLLLLATLPACTRSQPQYFVSPHLEASDTSFARTVEAHTLSPRVPGNGVTLLLNGDEIFPAMLGAIRSARRTITFTTFLYEDGDVAGQMAEALAERCRAGVGVNVLVDAVGSHRMTREARDSLQRSGCHFERFRPLNPLDIRRVNGRTHRRLLVVDGRVAFTGGSGIGTKWAGNGRQPGYWRQTDVRVEGPIARHLQGAFVDLWRESTGMILGGDAYFPDLARQGDIVAQSVKSSPGGGSSEAYMLFLLSIESARSSVAITTPYFLPDEQISTALVNAVRRGVRVSVLIAGVADNFVDRTVRVASRHALGGVLAGGVKVYEYTGALLHSKTLVIDGTWASIGSVNLDNRSFALNHELNLAIHDPGIARRLDAVFQEDLRFAREVTYEMWKRRGTARILEWFFVPLRDQL